MFRLNLANNVQIARFVTKNEIREDCDSIDVEMKSMVIFLQCNVLKHL